MLILYTTKYCPNCPKVRKYLREKGIDFLEVDAEKNWQEAQTYEIQAVPAVRIGKEVYIVGNNLKGLAGFLRRHGIA